MRIAATDNLSEVIAGLTGLERDQAPFALRRAINETAKLVAVDGNAAIRSVFDRPLPRTASAVKVFRGATKARMWAEVNVHSDAKGYDISDPRVTASGKSSVFPNRYLAAQIDGGPRVNKRFENALIKAGAMPAGKQAVFAKRSGYLDQFGNLSGARINQILSYFSAFPEAGHRANMTAKSRERLKYGTKDRATGGRKFAKGRKFGVEYFMSDGGDGLHPGVWERNFAGGAGGKTFIKPVLLFVDRAGYTRRFDFYGVMQKSVERHLPKQFEAAMELALRTARGRR